MLWDAEWVSPLRGETSSCTDLNETRLVIKGKNPLCPFLELYTISWISTTSTWIFIRSKVRTVSVVFQNTNQTSRLLLPLNVNFPSQVINMWHRLYLYKIFYYWEEGGCAYKYKCSFDWRGICKCITQIIHSSISRI